MPVTERRWPSVSLSNISIQNFIVTVPSTADLYIKQQVVLFKDGVTTQDYEIRAILNNFQLKLGKIGTEFNTFANPIAFHGGTLETIPERNEVHADVINRATYHETAIARRVILVNHLGESMTTAAAQLNIVDPAVKMIYEPFFKLVQIRERVPTVNFVDDILVFDHIANTITFTNLIPAWVEPTAQFVVTLGGGMNLGLTLTVDTIDYNLNQITVVESINDFTGPAYLDGSLGEIVKCTNFVYDSSCNIANIYPAYDVVKAVDLL